ncbi:DUF1489 domain-containing protein [Candidatus Kirkpatrickella diaphorinae]|uniref:DUF1489 domain-containing protein n=1 Tax=Candidatus Kirkpatrickella diaphorinae TaxID=2984322 RepID=A0ABY6GN15_9PROT|nr:DUF1489 domain-containing protein [Candidatus Kirkpatrickella diaphorinae]UYH52258.1 DUF1489 domain-containing protein [Candidatus Kirkpatrickella diaphorinae]
MHGTLILKAEPAFLVTSGNLPVLHLIKLTPGCATIEELAQRMREGDWHDGLQVVFTRTQPKRADEIAGKGSIYRVIAGFVAARQSVIRFEPHTRHDGQEGTMILVAPEIISVQPRPMRPFQGWRYYKPEDAPPDLTTRDKDMLHAMPTHMRKALAELCLL